MLLGAASLQAQPSIAIDAHLRGFKIWQIEKGAAADALPPVTTPAGKETVIRMVRNFSYPSQLDRNGAPTGFKTLDLGTTLTLTVFATPDGLFYTGRLDLAEAAGKNGSCFSLPSILSSLNLFKGTATSGKPVSIDILTPGGKKGVLKFTLTKLR